MRIVYITRFFWPTTGAAATGTLELIRGLTNRGHEVDLFVPDSLAPHMTAKRSQLALPEGLRVWRSKPRLSRLPGATLSFFFLGLKAFPTAYKAHVVIGAHHFAHLGSFCAAILAAIARRPLVIKVHDIFNSPLLTRESSGTIERALDSAMRWLARFSFRRAALVLVPGEELVDVVSQLYGLEAGKVHKLSAGVNTTEFNPNRRNDNLRRKIDSKHIVVFSGMINLAFFGLDLLVQATKLLRSSIPDLKVIIIGDGPDLSRLIQMTDSLGLDDTIQFLGGTSPELIPTYLASADVGIGSLRPSIGTFGGTPLKVVEYMASGCVVVIGRGGASKSLVIDGVNGVVVKSPDVADVAQSISRVLSDQKLAAKLGFEARDTAEKEYDWKKIVSELENRLRTLV